MEIRENIKVYHCNDKQRCEKFLKEDNYLIWSEEDGIWLGSGMYFWDNLSNAKYWKGEKNEKHIIELPFQLYLLIFILIIY